jgi:putative ABC transport system substrate-binding protein
MFRGVILLIYLLKAGTVSLCRAEQHTGKRKQLSEAIGVRSLPAPDQSKGPVMRRRCLLALLACAAVLSPAAASAERSEQIRRIGVLIGIEETDPSAARRVEALRAGLEELGWSERRNIQIAYRWGTDRNRLEAFARELVALKSDVIVASSSFVVAAVLRETRTTPVVFVTASDPTGDGFVTSLARPGGNATGFTNSIATVGGKWVEFLKEIAPGIARVAIMFNRETAPTGGRYFLQPIDSVAASFKVEPVPAPVRDRPQIQHTLADIASKPDGSLIVMPDNFTTIHRRHIIAEASRHRLPAIYPFRYFATEGGLMSYGADLIDLYRRTPIYIDRILRGAKPADLPVLAPTKFELVINMKTVKALGLNLPRILLARADEVIE